jgi:hypothetical protein
LIFSKKLAETPRFAKSRKHLTLQLTPTPLTFEALRLTANSTALGVKIPSFQWRKIVTKIKLRKALIINASQEAKIISNIF